VVLVCGALNSCDPGDIFETIRDVKAAHIKCSVIHLAASVRICEYLCAETGGTHSVALDDKHFADLLLKHCIPPPTVEALEPTLLPMGFPELKTGGDRTPCVCCKLVPTRTGIEEGYTRSGYFCPRCNAKHCELPTECRVCALHLVTAPHIARSYHHLFPVKPFSEVAVPPTGMLCAGCETFFSENRDGNDAQDRTAYRCTDCQSTYCFDCDVTIHEVVHNCPGCNITHTV
jgi:transcription initiation factor TFIIH subunit 2